MNWKTCCFPPGDGRSCELETLPRARVGSAGEVFRPRHGKKGLGREMREEGRHCGEEGKGTKGFAVFVLVRFLGEKKKRREGGREGKSNCES